MILMYHKVDIVTPSYWWVSSQRFVMQIDAMINAGYEFSYLDNYCEENKRQVILTFDDAYENLYDHAFPIMRDRQIPFEVFVIGNHLGGWNDFDKDEMRTRFCSLEQLQEMAESGARIQWHTRDHLRLTQIDSDELDHQLSINSHLQSKFQEPHLQWFAYPHGVHDQCSIDRIKKGFRGAVSVNDGTNSDRFQLNRITVDELWMPGWD